MVGIFLLEKPKVRSNNNDVFPFLSAWGGRGISQLVVAVNVLYSVRATSERMLFVAVSFLPPSVRQEVEGLSELLFVAIFFWFSHF